MEWDEKKQGEGGRLRASGSGNDEPCTEVAAYLFSRAVRRSYSVRFFFSHFRNGGERGEGKGARGWIRCGDEMSGEAALISAN